MGAAEARTGGGAKETSGARACCGGGVVWAWRAWLGEDVFMGLDFFWSSTFGKLVK